jgi:hypothetical protein
MGDRWGLAGERNALGSESGILPGLRETVLGPYSVPQAILLYFCVYSFFRWSFLPVDAVSARATGGGDARPWLIRSNSHRRSSRIKQQAAISSMISLQAATMQQQRKKRIDGVIAWDRGAGAGSRSGPIQKWAANAMMMKMTLSPSNSLDALTRRLRHRFIPDLGAASALLFPSSLARSPAREPD